MAAVGMSGEDEEMTVSSYSVAELWQRLPLHLTKDIISYFSFQDVGKLFRYSKRNSNVVCVCVCLQDIYFILQRITCLEFIATKLGRL